MFSFEEFKSLFNKSNNIPIDTSAFYAILESIPVSVCITDSSLPDNPIVYVNTVFKLITGYSDEEILGKNCRFLQGEGTNPESVRKIKKAILNESPINIVITNYRKNGERFENELIIVPVTIKGENRYFIAVQNDLSQKIYK